MAGFNFWYFAYQEYHWISRRTRKKDLRWITHGYTVDEFVGERRCNGCDIFLRQISIWISCSNKRLALNRRSDRTTRYEQWLPCPKFWWPTLGKHGNLRTKIWETQSFLYRVSSRWTYRMPWKTDHRDKRCFALECRRPKRFWLTTYGCW